MNCFCWKILSFIELAFILAVSAIGKFVFHLSTIVLGGFLLVLISCDLRSVSDGLICPRKIEITSINMIFSRCLPCKCLHECGIHLFLGARMFIDIPRSFNFSNHLMDDLEMM